MTATNTSARHYRLFVGIDIAYKTAAVAIIADFDDRAKPFSIEQDEKDFRKLDKRLQKTGHEPHDILIVMEATGTYWLKMAIYLYRAGYTVSVINPSTAFHFAQAVLKRSKNDPMDAQTLAQMGAILYRQLRLWIEPPPIHEALHQRLTQYDSVVRMRVQERNRRHALEQRSADIQPVLERMDNLDAILTGQIDLIKAEIEQLFADDDSAWSDSFGYLISIPGISTITAAWLLTATVNFETFDTPRQVASYIGLTPREKSSGTSVKGKAEIGYAGHKRLRHLMYTAAMSAIQHNPVIRASFLRMTEEHSVHGKKALIGAVRRLVHICWGCVKNQAYFDPDYHKGGKTADNETDTTSQA